TLLRTSCLCLTLLKPISTKLHSYLVLIVRPTTELYTLSLHDALPIYSKNSGEVRSAPRNSSSTIAGYLSIPGTRYMPASWMLIRSEEHTSELQSREKLVCRLLREKKKGNAT